MSVRAHRQKTGRKHSHLSAATLVTLIAGFLLLLAGALAPQPAAAAPVDSFGNGLFCGSGYLEAPYSGNIAFSGWSEFTIEMWVRPDGTVTGASQILQRQPAGATGRLQTILYLMPGNTLRAGLDDFSLEGWKYADTTQALPGGHWSHVCVVRQGTNLAIYINGAQAALNSAATWTSPPSASNQPMQFGGCSGLPSFAGRLDEVQVYNRALSSSDLAATYNRGLGQSLGRGTGPVRYYQLNESSGTTAADAGSDNASATLVNMGSSPWGPMTAGREYYGKNGAVVPLALAYGDPITQSPLVRQLTVPLHGDVSINQSTGQGTYTPDSGFTGTDSFMYFTTDASSLNAVSSSATIHMTADQFTITPSVVGGTGGSISPGSAQSYDYGSTPTFTFTPQSGYHVKTVRVDGSAVTMTGASEYTFSALTAGHTISVEFAADTLHAGFGNALSFSGAGYLSVFNNGSIAFSGASSYTVEMWVRPDSVLTRAQTLFRQRKSASENRLESWFALDTGNRLYAGLHSDSPAGWDWFAPATPYRLPINVWTHVAMVKDGGTVRLYANGQQLSSQAVSAARASTTATDMFMTFGGDTNEGDYLLGDLDEIQIYNRALSASDLAAVYNRGLGQTLAGGGSSGGSGPVRYFRLNEVSGTTAADAGSDGADAALSGMPASPWIESTAGRDAFSHNGSTGAVALAYGSAETGELSVSIVDQPAHGTIDLTSAALGHGTYTPADGWAGTESFTYRVGDGSRSVTATGTVTSDIDSFTITPSVVGGTGGSISPGTAQSYSLGSTPTFTFTPQSGYHIKTVRVDGSAVTMTDANEYTFPALTAAHTISVEFAADTLHAGFGNALSFSGASVSYLGAPNTPSVSFGGTSNFTVEMWVHPDTATTAQYTTLFRQRGSDLSLQSWLFFARDNHLRINYDNIGGGGNVWSAPSTQALPAERWTHVALVKQGDDTQLYLNGAPDVSLDISGWPASWARSSDSPLYFGGDPIDAPSITGRLDEIQVYNRALSASDVAAVYNRGMGQTLVGGGSSGGSGPVRYYRLNEASGTTAADAGSDGVDATLDNLPASPWVESTAGREAFSHNGSTGAVALAYGSAETGALSVSVVDQPAHGTIDLTSPALGQGTYTPADGWAGTESFTYRVGDGSRSVTATGTVTSIIDTFTITPSVVGGAGGHGSISPASAQSYSLGSTPTFTFTPSTGYHVKEVRVDGTLVSPTPTTSYTFAAVNSNHTISVEYAIDTFPITVSAGPHGGISPATQNWAYGSDATFTMTPATGYHVSGLTIDGTRHDPATSYTFGNVVAGHTIAASFSPDAPSGPVAGFGNALSFVGSATAAVETPNTADVSFGGGSQYTVEMWIRPQSGGADTQSLFGQGSTANETITQFGVTADHHLFFGLHWGNGDPVYHRASWFWGGFADVPALTVDRWAHVAMVNSGSGVSLYINGQCARSYAIGEPYHSSPLANGGLGFGSGFVGDMDEIQVYDRALSSTELANAYNRGLGQTLAANPDGSGPVRYYRLDESGTATTAQDWGLDGVDAVLTSMPASPWITSGAGREAFSTNGAAVPMALAYGHASQADLTVSVLAQPEHGTVTMTDAALGRATYTPQPGWAGTESFTYQVGDGTSTQTTTASVTSICDTFTITPSVVGGAGGHGSISPASAQSFNYGSTPTFTFTPDAGYRIDVVSVDGTPVTLTTSNSYTFSALRSGHQIQVSFVAEDPPAITALASSTHPDADTWYSNSNPAFTWDTQGEAAGFGYVLDKESATVPACSVTGSHASATLTSIADGVWYFHVRGVGIAGTNWGETATRAVRIDTTPPVTTAALSPASSTSSPAGDDGWFKGGPVTVTLEATDASSGVARTLYRVGSSGEYSVYSATDKPVISALGETQVFYYSVDKAGNAGQAESIAVKIKPIAAPSPRPVHGYATVLVRRGSIATIAFSVRAQSVDHASVVLQVLSGDNAADAGSKPSDAANAEDKASAPASDDAVSNNPEIAATTRGVDQLAMGATRVVKTIRLGSVPTNTQLRSRFRCRLADGVYRYRITATDAYGQTGQYSSGRLVVGERPRIYIQGGRAVTAGASATLRFLVVDRLSSKTHLRLVITKPAKTGSAKNASAKNASAKNGSADTQVGANKVITSVDLGMRPVGVLSTVRFTLHIKPGLYRYRLTARSAAGITASSTSNLIWVK